MIEFDPEKVRQNGPGAVRMLGRLANAIILQQKLGVEFDRSIKVEMGDAVALLVSCVKKETDDAGTTERQEGGEQHGARADNPAPEGIRSDPGLRRMEAKRFPGSKPRLRSQRTTAQPSTSTRKA